MGGGAAQHLAAARAGMDQVRALLIAADPHSVERCEIVLGAVVGELAQAREYWKKQAPDSAEAGELTSLMGSIRVTKRLLFNGMAYHGKWHRILSAMAGGYTAEGSPAPLGDRRLISLAG